jgi:hypothetical protein
MRPQSAAAEVATPARGNTNGNDCDDASGADATQVPQTCALENLESIRHSIAAGYSFGPRNKCACCHEKNADSDSVGRGICEKCWTAIQKEMA